MKFARLSVIADSFQATVVVKNVQNIHLVDLNQTPEHIISNDTHIIIALRFEFDDSVLDDRLTGTVQLAVLPLYPARIASHLCRV